MIERIGLAEAFEQQWRNGSSPDLDSFVTNAGAVDTSELSRLARIDQAESWQRGGRRLAEYYLERFPTLCADGVSVVDLVYHEYLLREKLADQPSLEDFKLRFPQYADELSDQIGLHLALSDAFDIGDMSPSSETVTHLERNENALLKELPAEFGRYRVLQLLGCGGMGSVYLAEDTQLCRRVALKLPRFDRDVSPEVLNRFRREARIAATFHHPNLCPVYDFGEFAGTLFLTMPFMTGRLLSDLIAAGPMPESTALQIALTIARAMSVAHQTGVIHRDLKPANVILQDDGEPVVMDFGLAWRHLEFDPNQNGDHALVGTLAYMPPEQLNLTDREASPISDVYSLGVILYEMLTGRRPFEGNWQEVAIQINTQLPLAPSHHLPSLSIGLDRACLKALSKEPGDRFASMNEFADALTPYIEQHRTASDTFAKSIRRSRRRNVMAFSIACCLAFVCWFAWQLAAVDWARRQVPQIEKLAVAGRYFEAYELAVSIRHSLPDDPKLTRLMPVISDVLSVQSEPTGASVYVKRWAASQTDAAPTRRLVGTTPISDLEIARGEYIVSVEKEGFVPFQRTWSGVVGGGLDVPIVFKSVPVNAELTPVTEGRKGMVLVPGSDYRLVAWRRPTDILAKLDDYFVDTCEVTNREYQDFVNAGGYMDEQYWTFPFIKDSKTLTWQEALLELTDRTGMAGPRGWSHQTFPDGQADHPVTGITWFEAAAYAAFRDKTLPTIFQWEKAARDGVNNPFGPIMPWGRLLGSADGHANFVDTGGNGTIPVGHLEFGMSPFGCFEMAGNASEWCLNETSEGFISGGSSWGSYAYEFGWYATYPGFYSSDRLGFRCVAIRAGATGDQGAAAINIDDEVPKFTPEPESKVREWFANYDYEYLRSTALDAQVEVTETKDWRRERISYVGADGKRVLAYLYLPPQQFAGPHQVIHIVPAGDVTRRHRTLPQSIEADYASFIRSGRAVFSVVLEGYMERDRPRDWTEPDFRSREFAEQEARHIVDLRRGIDYLESRDDIDANKIAFMQASAGAMQMVLPAIDSRYRAEVLWGAKITKSQLQMLPEASSINFVPLIRIPKLLVHGLYDELSPLKTTWQPLFDLLPEPKEKVLFAGGHVPDVESLAPTVNKFLDEIMGAPGSP